ncbi:hypothetical protein KI387_000471 [Taxus chinensis]|uniref:Cytochrome P450 n=1 Tax=Taxus chinensis TaxID=29808 RepID=A0AA38GU63_TAXCH|nr:hypothetical protein KI387_000471 [Taxus chinensis]
MMMEKMGASSLLFTAFLVGIWSFLLGFFIKNWWRPWTIHRALTKRGFKGPPPRFLIGNLLDIANIMQHEHIKDMPTIHHNIRNRVFPFFVKWAQQYGERFVIWFGNEPRIVLTDPGEIKELLSSKNLSDSGVSPLHQEMLSLAFGKSLVTVNGEKWAQQRRVVAPAFHTEKLKGVVGISARCTKEMLDEWRFIDEKACEIELISQMKALTANIFIRSQYGLDYQRGREIFEDMNSLEGLIFESFRYSWIPGGRFLPTATNRKIWKWNRRMEKNLKLMIQERLDSGSYGNDLLGLMLTEIDRVSADDKNFSYTMQQLMDESKTFFLAGKDNTSTLICWALLLLALNPHWQDKARQEAKAICGIQDPTPDSVKDLKIIGMILNETLRLYSPAPGIIKQAFKDLNVGEDGLVIPKGVNVIVDILAVHRDPKLWSADANEFNPARFVQGISKAGNHPSAFIPFSSGPRVCIGQNFAVLQAKVVMAMVLRDFKFGISSHYRHAPVAFLTLSPQHGMPIMVEKVHS